MAVSGDWAEGYITDTLYTDNVYREQSPVRLNYVAALKGCMPRPLDEPFTYLELGCALGHSITVFAAALPKGRFIGVDFNPAQIDFAQRRARALGLDNITFIEASFQDIAADAAGQGVARDIGKVDFAALHGVFSWISADARAAAQRILLDRVKPGGLVYNSYNCLPGWSHEAPVQRLFKELAEGVPGSSASRARTALKSMQAMLGARTGYFTQSARASLSLQGYAKKSDAYLAHEFLNASWNAFYSPDIFDAMAQAKLDFLGSATLTENHADLLFDDGQAKLVNEQPDQRRRQLMQDFILNQQFRRDVYVRGHAHLDATQTHANRRHQILVATADLVRDATTQVKMPRGMIGLDKEQLAIFTAIAGEWAGSEADLIEAFVAKGGRRSEFQRLQTFLAAARHLAPAAIVPKRGAAKPAKPGEIGRHMLGMKANTVELARAIAQRVSALLVSPVTADTKMHRLTEALLIDEILRAGGSYDDLAKRLQARVLSLGVTVQKNGKPVTDAAEIGAELRRVVEDFAKWEIPALARLGIMSAL